MIQTYNKTTYDSCIIDDALDSDTFQFGGGRNEFGSAMTVDVPLVIEGTQYYFSDANDGEQCQQGMAFKIKVGHGLGLPPSLNQPPPPAYVPPPGPADVDEGQLPPGTVANTPPSSNHAIMTGASFSVSLLLVLLSMIGC